MNGSITQHERIRRALESDIGRENIRRALTWWSGSEPDDADVERIARVWPITTYLLTSAPDASADEFLKGLPDDLFWQLLGLARDFYEWSDENDFGTWESQFFFLVSLIVLNERGRSSSDEEMAVSARALANAVLVEALRRDGRFQFVEAHSLTSLNPPRRIPTKLSTPEH